MVKEDYRKIELYIPLGANIHGVCVKLGNEIDHGVIGDFSEDPVTGKRFYYKNKIIKISEEELRDCGYIISR